jgi:hypothetical protein
MLSYEMGKRVLRLCSTKHTPSEVCLKNILHFRSMVLEKYKLGAQILNTGVDKFSICYLHNGFIVPFIQF